MRLSTQMLQIRDKAALIYTHNEYSSSIRTSKFQLQLLEKARNNAYSGLLSSNSKKRLTRAITLLVQSSPSKKIFNPVTNRYYTHRLSFLTLTLTTTAGSIDASYAYKNLLKPFLQWLTKTKKVTTYVWKAETQKNGQLHYHITTPSFIHFQEIQHKWNYICRKKGLLKEFEKQYGHSSPNSTDIHKVNHIKNLASYMLKEFIKTIQNSKSVNGKVWDCSDNLKGVKYFTTPFQAIHGLLLDSACSYNFADKFTGEQFTLVKFKEDIEEFILEPNELQQYKYHMQAINKSFPII